MLWCVAVPTSGLFCKLVITAKSLPLFMLVVSLLILSCKESIGALVHQTRHTYRDVGSRAVVTNPLFLSPTKDTRNENYPNQPNQDVIYGSNQYVKDTVKSNRKVIIQQPYWSEEFHVRPQKIIIIQERIRHRHTGTTKATLLIICTRYHVLSKWPP